MVRAQHEKENSGARSRRDSHCGSALFRSSGLLLKWSRDSERKASGLQEKSLRVEDHEIVYLEGGQGEPDPHGPWFCGQ